MNWIKQGSCWISLPYRIFSHTRGSEVWFQADNKYGILTRGIDTVEAAKAYAEAHKAQQSQPG